MHNASLAPLLLRLSEAFRGHDEDFGTFDIAGVRAARDVEAFHAVLQYFGELLRFRTLQLLDCAPDLVLMVLKTLAPVHGMPREWPYFPGVRMARMEMRSVRCDNAEEVQAIRSAMQHLENKRRAIGAPLEQIVLSDVCCVDEGRPTSIVPASNEKRLDA